MKLRFNSLRYVLTGAFAIAGAAAALTCTAQTTISSTSNLHATSSTDWTDTLTVPAFNGALGTLTSVTVTLNWNTYQALSATNIDSVAETIFASDTTAVTLTMPNSDAPLVGTPPVISLGAEMVNTFGTEVASGTLAVGATLVAGTAAGVAGPLTTSSTTAVTLTDAPDLATFTGTATSTVSFPVGTATTVIETEDGGNITWAVTTQAGASVTVSYTYTPTTTTTPGCVQGTVINNICGDGRSCHSTETGLGAGITIDVYTTKGVLVGTAVTKADGTFEVTGLLPNTTYIVMVVASTLPSGYMLSCTANCVSVTTPGSGCVTGVNFTAVQCNKGCQYNTFCQSDWCCTENCSTYNSCLKNCYCIVYPEGNCTLGGSSASCCLNSCSGIEGCLVHSGQNCPLPRGCTTNPQSYCYLGQLVGETLCCKLNCDFSNAGIFCTGFKSLTCQYGQFKGCTVAQVLNAAHCYLNGDTCLPDVPKCTGNDLCSCLQSINQCFASSCGNGSGSGFCQ